MKRLFSLCLLVCSFLWGDAQVVIQRAGAANTVNDPRHMASLNEYLPTYADTAEANLPAHKGIDSAGAVIYTYDVKGFWYRQHNPKKWVRFGSVLSLSVVNDSTLSYTAGDGSLTNLSVPGKRNKFYYDGYGINMPNDSTFEADTAQLATLWDLNQVTFGSIGGVDTSGRTYYVTNGLTARNDSTHKLGGTLDEATQITIGNQSLRLTQNNGSYTLWNNYSNGFPQWEFYHQHTDGSWTDLYNYSTTVRTGVVASAKRAAASGGVEWNLQSLDTYNYALVKTQWASGAGFTSLGQQSYARDSSTSIALFRSFSTRGATARLDSAGIHLRVGDATYQTKGLSVEHASGEVLLTSLKTGSAAPVQSGTVKMVTTDGDGRLSFADVPAGGGGAEISADNGLTENVAGNVQLGGTLIQNTTETLAGYQLTFNGTGSWSYIDSRFWWDPGGARGSYEDTYAKGTLTLSEETFTTRVAFKDLGTGGGTGYQEVKVNGEELALYASNGLGLAHLDLFGGVTALGTAPNALAIRLGVNQTGVSAQMGVNLTKDFIDLGYDVDDALGADFEGLRITSARHLLFTGQVPTYADNAAAITGGLATNTVYKTADGTLKIVYAP